MARASAACWRGGSTRSCCTRPGGRRPASSAALRRAGSSPPIVVSMSGPPPPGSRGVVPRRPADVLKTPRSRQGARGEQDTLRRAARGTASPIPPAASPAHQCPQGPAFHVSSCCRAKTSIEVALREGQTSSRRLPNSQDADGTILLSSGTHSRRCRPAACRRIGLPSAGCGRPVGDRPLLLEDVGAGKMRRDPPPRPLQRAREVCAQHSLSGLLERGKDRVGVFVVARARVAESAVARVLPHPPVAPCAQIREVSCPATRETRSADESMMSSNDPMTNGTAAG